MLFLLACSSPGVHLSTTAHPDHPTPGGLSEVVEGQVRRSIETCYELAGGKIEGTVTVSGYGSHGVLTVSAETPTAPQPLQDCVTNTLASQKVQRALVDGDTVVGFRLAARFGK